MSKEIMVFRCQKDDEVLEDMNQKLSLTEQELYEHYIEYLGGADNIVKVDNCATRLRLDVVDSSMINEVALKKIGAKGVMKLNRTTAQVIVGTKVEFVADGIKALLK